jgi:hypothetical protein
MGDDDELPLDEPPHPVSKKRKRQTPEETICVGMLDLVSSADITQTASAKVCKVFKDALEPVFQSHDIEIDIPKTYYSIKEGLPPDLKLEQQSEEFKSQLAVGYDVYHICESCHAVVDNQDMRTCTCGKVVPPKAVSITRYAVVLAVVRCICTLMYFVIHGNVHHVNFICQDPNKMVVICDVLLQVQTAMGRVKTAKSHHWATVRRGGDGTCLYLFVLVCTCLCLFVLVCTLLFVLAVVESLLFGCYANNDFLTRCICMYVLQVTCGMRMSSRIPPPTND